MPLTNSQVAALTLGYLSGADLMGFCPVQLIINANIVLPTQPQAGCTMAYTEVKAALINRYDIAAELAKTPTSGTDNSDNRDQLCVKITALLAIRNFLGSAANISPYLENLFKWAEKSLLAVRDAQLNMNIPYPPQVTATLPDGTQVKYSPGDQAKLVCSSFQTLG